MRSSSAMWWLLCFYSTSDIEPLSSTFLACPSLTTSHHHDSTVRACVPAHSSSPAWLVDFFFLRVCARVSRYCDDLPENADGCCNQALSSSIKSLKTSELVHKTRGESLLMTAVKAKKAGVVATLVCVLLFVSSQTVDIVCLYVCC